MFKLKALLVASLCVVGANNYASDNDNMEVDFDNSNRDLSPVRPARRQLTSAPNQTSIYNRAARRRRVADNNAALLLPAPLLVPAAVRANPAMNAFIQELRERPAPSSFVSLDPLAGE